MLLWCWHDTCIVVILVYQSCFCGVGVSVVLMLRCYCITGVVAVWFISRVFVVLVYKWCCFGVGA